MAEYIDLDTPLELYVEHGGFCKKQISTLRDLLDTNRIPYKAADVLPRDEAIKMGAELAAMHGSDATSQQLEEAYLKGVEDGMTRRDVRPVVVCADCKHNNACLTQAFVEDESKVPFDRNTFFCADGKRADDA